MFDAGDAPITGYVTKFRVEAQANQVSLGALDGYPVPHLAIRSANMDILKSATMAIHQLLDAGHVPYTRDILRDGHGQLIVVFFCFSGVSVDFRLNTLGEIRSNDFSLNEERVKAGLAKMLLPVKSHQALAQQFWDTWVKGNNQIGDSAQLSNDRAMGSFNIHIERFTLASSDQHSVDVYKELLQMSVDLINEISPVEMENILRNISGDKTLNLKDISKDVHLSYVAEGSHKYVFKLDFFKNNGSRIHILLAAKKEKVKGDITGHELNNLKQLNGRGAPRWGGTFISKDGRRWLLEEFIVGKTLEQLDKEGKLTKDLKEKAIASLFYITNALGGMVPRDMHSANFMVREDTGDVVMVDIGDKRLFILGKNASAKHQTLFLGILLAQYGARDIPQDNYFIFDTILANSSHGAKAGELILENAVKYMSANGIPGTKDLFFEQGWNMFWNIGATRENQRNLIDFTKNLIDGLTAYVKDKIGGSVPMLNDEAMKANTGGIDLTPANMNLQTQNAGEGIKFHLDPAVLQQLQNAPGFVPVIINIQPMNNLYEFLGLNQPSQLNAG
jgi:hypothetical protein